MTWSDVYDFWFGSPGSESHGKVRDFWFGGGPEIDTEITERFSGTYDVAISGRLEPWTAEPRGALSLIIVLDQFPRNMFRGNAKSFASDHLALSNAKKLLESPAHQGLTMVEKMFAYLPFEHSENLEKLIKHIEFSDLGKLVAKAEKDASETHSTQRAARVPAPRPCSPASPGRARRARGKCK